MRKGTRKVVTNHGFYTKSFLRLCVHHSTSKKKSDIWITDLVMRKETSGHN